MSCTGLPGCVCGCCAGVAQETPGQISNRAGLSSIDYRVARFAQFKATMLARLSSSDYPALQSLRTRSDDDFSIALLDGTAMMLDVLTFYQERLANESYLRTAQNRDSVLRLAALVAYTLNPGVAAQTSLAFSLKAGAAPVTVPIGTQVQSVPVSGKTAQTFETIEAITAHSDWCAMAVQTTETWIPQSGHTFVYLAGTSTQLSPGDVILIVGDERRSEWWSYQWDARVVLTVTPDTVMNRTLVTWNEGLGSPSGSEGPAQLNPKVFVFRQKAALFGYNALNPNLLNNTSGHPQLGGAIGTDAAGNWYWNDYGLGSTIDLDAAYPKITQGGWVVLVVPDTPNPARSLQGFVNLYQVTAVSQIARSDFALSAKITSVVPDTTEYLGSYPLQTTLALAQSEQLAVAPQPLLYPLYGQTIEFAALIQGLVPGQSVAVSGRRQKVALTTSAAGLSLVLADGTLRKLSSGDVLTLTAGISYLANGAQTYLAPADFGAQLLGWEAAGQLVVQVADRDGAVGFLTGGDATNPWIPASALTLVPVDKSDPLVQEVVTIGSQGDAVTLTRDRTSIALSAALQNCYDRTTVQLNANVAAATHGASVSEILGAGAAALANQSFGLKQSPVTYVSASTPSGGQSTLQVRANDLLWNQEETLYGATPTDTGYVAQLANDGSTTVLFGDGVEGARLPTGQNNIRAQYRVGLGTAGNLDAGSLTNLLDRPLGVNGVINPVPATGGADAQSIADARTNVPLFALTLGRAVSLEDYRNFSQAFAGIAKAQANWIASGPQRGILVTVAGVNGATVDPSSATYVNLVSALREYGDPFVPINVQSYNPATFALNLNVGVAQDADQTVVLPAVESALRRFYSFANRGFGQSVSVDEIDTVVQAVAGVVALNVQTLTPASGAAYQLLATNLGLPYRISVDPSAILTLDCGPLDLGVMS